MSIPKKSIRLLAAVLALLLLCGCGAETPAPTTAPTEEPAAAPTDAPPTPTEEAVPVEESGKDVVQVSNVDGMLAAIKPNTVIELAPGVYDLSTASDYGQGNENGWYRWNDTGDGYELEIIGVEGLTLKGAGTEETTLIAEDPFACVLAFSSCSKLTVSGLTAGHGPQVGMCGGGVIRTDNCSDVTIEGCGLFGCGTIGVWATGCSGLTVTGTRIYECSNSAVMASSCRDVRVLDCEVDHNGRKYDDYTAYCLFQTDGGDGFLVHGCRIHDNSSYLLLRSAYTRNTMFLSNRVEYNDMQYGIDLTQYPAVVDGCAFSGNRLTTGLWYGGDSMNVSLRARNQDGDELDDKALESMTYREIDPNTVEGTGPLREPVEVPKGGEITVANTDELLAAIGPDRTIILDGELFDLSQASDYGSMGGTCYYWQEQYDGPELVIVGVSNLTIRAKAENPADTSIVAVPRYANVLSFRGCENIRLEGFTAGHTQEPGYCCGGVLDFESCKAVELRSCRMYGCGTLGLYAWDCTGLRLQDCEIYDCSQGGVMVSGAYDISFEECRIHDVPSPAVSVFSCGSVLWNGETVEKEYYNVDRNGRLVPYEPGGDPNAVITDAPDSLSLYCQGEEKTELTLNQGDSVILRAEAFFPVSREGKVNFSWSCDDAGALGLTVCRDNNQCIVKGLAAKEGGVLLTVTCNGVTETIRVYILSR